MPYKVAVLMGGTSHERDFSLESGRRICEALEANGHQVVPLDLTPDLTETLRSEKPDVAYNALHGKFGEDGSIQSLMELLAIPYVGCRASVCRLTWNKPTLPDIVGNYRGGQSADSSWPTGICLSTATFEDMGAASALDRVAECIPSGYPLAVKPTCQGSALGMSKVIDEKDLPKALLKAFSFGDEAIIEEWVDGVELAVGILGEGERAYALPPVEIVPQKGLFDTEARLDAEAVDYYAPVRLSSLGADEAQAQAIRSDIERAALEVHRAYGCRDLSRVDIIWDGANARVLEIDISPGMGERSLFPIACHAAGLTLGGVLDELLEEAIARG